MADWYVSSATYATLSTWAASTAYTVGTLIKPTAPAAGREWVFRCTTAGTSGSTEPNWSGVAGQDGATVGDGGVTWTNVSGRSAYGWSAAAGSLYCISNQVADRTSIGDRVFLSSDHSESGKGNNYNFNSGTAAFGLIEIISVNRSGSVPPVAGDSMNGAAITVTSGSLILDAFVDMFWQGITFTETVAGNISFNSGGIKAHYLKNCTLVFSTTNGGSRITANNPSSVTLDNTPVQFGATGQAFGSSGYQMIMTWINTPFAIQGSTIPTTLFNSNNNGTLTMTARGVDLSAITGTLVGASSSAMGNVVLLDSCKIAAGVVRLAGGSVNSFTSDQIELVNCYDGTNILNERHSYAGDVTTDRSTYLTSGAQDDIGNYALKLVSSHYSDFAPMPLDAFAFDVENTVTGVSKTATVEVLSSGTLNNNDIRLLLEYMGGVPVAWNSADSSGSTFSNGNLTISCNSGSSGGRATNGYSTGKYYFEYPSFSGSVAFFGLAPSTTPFGNNTGAAVLNAGGTIYINGTVIVAIPTGSVNCIAIDFTNALIWFRNGPTGNWNNSGTANPATGTGGLSISGLSFPLFPYVGAPIGSVILTANFGASGFIGVVPSGFIAGLPGSSTSSIASFVDSLPSVLVMAGAWNPNDASNMNFSNNNLAVSSSGLGGVRAVLGFGTGKYYFEVMAVSWSNSSTATGLATASANVFAGASTGTVSIGNSGAIWIGSTNTGSSLGTRANGDTIGIAVDLSAQLIWLRVCPSGNWNGSGTANPATGTGGISISALGGVVLFPFCHAQQNSEVFVANFASAFSGSVPSGFTAGWGTTSVLPLSSNTWTNSPATSWNPFDLANLTLSNSNLTVTSTSSDGGVRSSSFYYFGKYYFEGTITALASNFNYGVATTAQALSSANCLHSALVQNSGGIVSNNVSVGSIGISLSVGMVICVAIDMVNQMIWIRGNNGNWNNSGTANPATNTGGISLSSVGFGGNAAYAFASFNGVGNALTANFGATAFAYAVPSGFTGFSVAGSKQLLQTTFTPQRAGRVRGLVRLGKPNTTVWVNPQIAIS